MNGQAFVMQPLGKLCMWKVKMLASPLLRPNLNLNCCQCICKFNTNQRTTLTPVFRIFRYYNEKGGYEKLNHTVLTAKLLV